MDQYHLSMHREEQRKANPPSMSTQAATETSIWDVYNNKTWLIDQELIKDWTNSLNILLVFAAIFAAVLTAFIIESKKLLEEDPQNVLVSAVTAFMGQQANGTFKPFEKPTFVAPHYAVVTNGLFFAAICCSLVAAVASVVALQWIGEYDAGLVQALSAKDRALRRHFRYMGMERWKMAQIITLLPLLLYLSLFLFFGGLTIWMWHINKAIGGILVVGFSLACLFYIVTTVITIIDPSAPFRSPFSRSALVITIQVSRWAKSKIAYVLHTISLNIGSFYELSTYREAWSTAAEREEHAVNSNLKLESKIFVWMVENREILKVSRKRLMWTIEWGATLRDQPSLEDEFAPIQRRELIVSASQSFAHTTISQCTIQDLNDITTLWQACQTSVFHDCVSIFKTTFSRLFPLESVNNEEFGHLIQLARWRLTPDQPNHLLWWKSTCMRRFASSPPSSTLTIRVHLYMLRELCNFIRANPGAPWMSLYLKYLAETINLSPSKLRHPATILVPRTLVDEMLLALYAALTQQSTSDVTFDDFFDGVLLNKSFSLHQELRDSAVILCASAILQYCAHLYQAVTTQQSQRLLLIIYQLLILWSGVLQGQSNGYPELMAELSQESTKMLLRGRYLSIKWLLSPHIDSFPYLCDVLMVLIDVKRTRPSLGSFCQFFISREEVSLIQPRTSYNPGAKDSVYRLQRTLELGPSPENQASQVQAIDGLMQSTTRIPGLRSLLVMMLASGSLVNLEGLESVHPIANRSLALLLNTYRKHIIELPHDLNERKSLMESDHWALALDFWLHRRQRFDDTPATSLLLEVILSANSSCHEKAIQCSEERVEVCGAIQEAIRSKLASAWFEGSSYGFVTLSRIRFTTWFPTFLLQLLQGSSGDHLVRWLLLFFRSEISNDLLLDMVEKDPSLHLRFVAEMYMQGAGASIPNRHLILALRNTTKRRIATKKRTTIKEIPAPSQWLPDLIEESKQLRRDRIYPTRNSCVASMLF